MLLTLVAIRLVAREPVRQATESHKLGEQMMVPGS